MNIDTFIKKRLDAVFIAVLFMLFIVFYKGHLTVVQFQAIGAVLIGLRLLGLFVSLGRSPVSVAKETYENDIKGKTKISAFLGLLIAIVSQVSLIIPYFTSKIAWIGLGIGVVSMSSYLLATILDEYKSIPTILTQK